MSSIASLTSAPTALPQINVHPHGHKKGPHAESSGDSSDTAAQIPAGAAQNLFGTLLNSLEQVIGVKLSAPASAAAAQNPQANGSQTPKLVGSGINVSA
jgi:hypothetical protein